MTLPASPSPPGSARSLRQATTLSSAINLANTMLGSGMLAMSAAIASIGLGSGILVISLSSFAAGLGLYFLTHSALAIRPTPSSYFSVCQRTYPSSAVLFDLAIAIKCFGVGISYFIVVGDLMPKIVAELMPELANGSPTMVLDRRLWVTVAAGVATPLMFLRRLNSLRYTSMVALTAVVYLLVIVVYYYFFAPGFVPAPSDQLDMVVRQPWSWRLVLQHFPIFVFAFTCHQNMFSICNELRESTASRLHAVIVRVVGISLAVYQVVGVLGYLSFGRSVKPDLVLMYGGHSLLITVGRAFLVVMFVFSYPLQAHPCRASVAHVVAFVRTTHGWRDKSMTAHSRLLPSEDDIAFGLAPNDSPAEEPLPPVLIEEERALETAAQDDHPASLDLPTGMHITLSTLILLGSYIVAMTVESLHVVLAWVGSTGSTTISFILPGVFYYKLHEHHPWTTRKRLAVGLALYGLLVMVVCLAVNLSQVWVSYHDILMVQ